MHVECVGEGVRLSIIKQCIKCFQNLHMATLIYGFFLSCRSFSQVAKPVGKPETRREQSVEQHMNTHGIRITSTIVDGCHVLSGSSFTFHRVVSL